jgi:hypothetical protein
LSIPILRRFASQNDKLSEASEESIFQKSHPGVTHLPRDGEVDGTEFAELFLAVELGGTKHLGERQAGVIDHQHEPGMKVAKVLPSRKMLTASALPSAPA